MIKSIYFNKTIMINNIYQNSSQENSPTSPTYLNDEITFSRDNRNQYSYLVSVSSKLHQVIESLTNQYRELENKYNEEQKKLYKLIQEKDKLILSLTKINSGLLKENGKLKRKSDAQFQYFVKRVAETESKAMQDKKQLEQHYNQIIRHLLNQTEGHQQNIKLPLSHQKINVNNQNSQHKMNKMSKTLNNAIEKYNKDDANMQKVITSNLANKFQTTNESTRESTRHTQLFNKCSENVNRTTIIKYPHNNNYTQINPENQEKKQQILIFPQNK